MNEWGIVGGRPGYMFALSPAAYPPQRPELLANMGFELTPFTTGGVSGYTLHRAGCAPFIHNPEAANLPHVDTVRNTLRSNSLTAAEFDRWKQRSSSTSNDPFLLAKLAMNGLLPSPQDVWDVCCGYETKHQELRCSFAEYVRTSGDTVSALQKEILQVSIPRPPQPHRRNFQPTLAAPLYSL